MQSVAVCVWAEVKLDGELADATASLQRTLNEDHARASAAKDRGSASGNGGRRAKPFHGKSRDSRRGIQGVKDGRFASTESHAAMVWSVHVLPVPLA